MGVDEGTVRRGTEDDLALHRIGERGLTTALDEREDAAAETRAHDARAQAAFHSPRALDDRIDLRRRHLEIIAKALVRLLEKRSQSFEAAFFERVGEGVD